MAQVVAKFPSSLSRQSIHSAFLILNFLCSNSHQAAQLLAIHHKTLQKLARRGEIRGSRVGKDVAFPRI